MREAALHPALLRALAVSAEMLQRAGKSDFHSVALLDVERLQLLKSYRVAVRHVDADSRNLLQKITELNDRTIGLLEHQRRGKGREMDMAAVGRRAVAAYSNLRLQR